MASSMRTEPWTGSATIRSARSARARRWWAYDAPRTRSPAVPSPPARRAGGDGAATGQGPDWLNLAGPRGRRHTRGGPAMHGAGQGEPAHRGSDPTPGVRGGTYHHGGLHGPVPRLSPARAAD